MRATVRLALASLRKSKAHMTVLAGFAALAAMMVNLGLVLATDYPASFDAQARAAKVPDLIDLTSDRLSSPARDAQVDDHPGVGAVEREPVLWPDGRFAYRDGSNETETNPLVAVYGTPRSMDLPRLRDGAQPLGDDGIYLPNYFRITAGYAVGDTFTFTFDKTPVAFTVRGFTDEVVFGGTGGPFRFYVGDSTFARLGDQLSGYAGVYTKIRLDDPTQTEAISTLLSDAAFDQQVTGPTAFSFQWTYAELKTAGVYMGQILASILLVAALIIALVALVVVRFRVVASIEESMTNIGITKAVGYTSGQVAGSLVGQFVLVAAAGAAVGAGAGYALLPVVADLLEQQSARPWTPGLAPVPTLVTLAVVTGATLVVAGVAALRIRRLSPLRALRSGLAVHTFKRNHLPLATSRGPLAWLLATKSAVQAKGQTVTVGVVVAAVTFMGVVAVALYQNVGVNSKHFGAVAFGESPDFAFYAPDADAVARLRTDLAARPGVRSAFFYSAPPIRVDGTQATATVTDDFTQTEGTLLYRGRYPRHDNEVAIGWTTASTLGKKIGDTVRIDNGGQDAEFLITGLTNFSSVCLTTDGMRQVDPQFRHHQVYAYLDDPNQAASLTDELNHDTDVPGLVALNGHEEIATQIAIYGTIMLAVSVVVLAVTGAVVVLVLFLVLSMAILRGRRGLGIQKGVGFTTGQLVRQVVATYLPVVAVGAVVGGAAGHLMFPSVIDAVFQTLDAHVTSMHASVATTATLTVAVVVVAGTVATLVATKVRKVSAYTLITE